MGRPDDRPGDELREERDVEQEIDRRPRGRDGAAMDVDDVGDALEGEEGDADRQDDLQERQLARHPHREEEVVQGFDEEAVRSEEHTSELQSLMRSSYAVFCLKKK